MYVFVRVLRPSNKKQTQSHTGPLAWRILHFPGDSVSALLGQLLGEPQHNMMNAEDLKKENEGK